MPFMHQGTHNNCHYTTLVKKIKRSNGQLKSVFLPHNCAKTKQSKKNKKTALLFYLKIYIENMPVPHPQLGLSIQAEENTNILHFSCNTNTLK